MKKISLIVSLVICQFYFANAFNLKGDSLVSKYDINDPRNPHCACHKYQKIADEEYKKLLGKEIHLVSDENKLNSGKREVNSTNKINAKKFRVGQFTRNFLSVKKKKTTKCKKVKRLRKDNTACFHF